MSDITLDGIEPVQGLFPDSLLDTFERRPLTPVEESTQAVANEILNNEPAPSASPLDPEKMIHLDPAREMINAGAAFEKKSTEELHLMETESNQIIESIDLLLDLSRELANVNAENPKLTPMIRDLVQKLKDKGINLINLEEGKEIDKEQFSALKATIGSHVDKLRTKIQQIFTKMQTVIQNMSSVNDSVKKMLTEQSDLIRKILERSIKH